MTVTSMLSGGVTPDGATVVAEVGAGVSCRLAYSLDPALAGAAYSAPVSADSDGYARMAVTGLTSASTYYYGIEAAGVLDSARGRFKTHPPVGEPASFMIAHATCEQGVGGLPSTHKVFDAMRLKDPLMFMHIGDLHYKNIDVADKSLYLGGIRSSITADRQWQFYRSINLSYVWDDHDYGPDNGDSTNPGRAEVAAAYRQAIPHYPLNEAGAIYQAWTIGRVRFIMTDLRYHRSPNTDTDDASKSMLGATQKAWLKAEMLAAKDGPLTVWLNSQVWLVNTFIGIDSDGDHWGAYATERAEIDNFRAANGITNVIDLTGDMHALGIGTADFSTAQSVPKRIYSGSSLDSIPVLRGGAAWTTSQVGRGQYGTLTVTDHATHLTVLWQGWQVDDSTGVETLWNSETFTAGDPPMPGRHWPRKWSGTDWVTYRSRVHDGANWAAVPGTGS